MNKNLGLDLLRVWLSFEVVVDHFWHQKGLVGPMAFLSNMRSLAVPCFLLMSFYLTARRSDEGDFGWLKTRTLRLGLPFLVWPLIYFGAIWLMAALSPAFVESTLRITELKVYGFDLALDGWDLLRQWFFGMDRRLLHQFWFHHNLIILTLAMFFLLRMVKAPRTRTYVLVGLMCLGFVLQYSSMNKWLFGDWLWEGRYSFGRLAATLPYAALGLMLGFNRKTIEAARPGTKALCVVVGAFTLFFVHYGKVMPRPSGLGYQGLNLIVMALGATAFFYFLPLAKIPVWLVKALQWISRYCMGIYCAHLLVGYAMYAWVLPKMGVVFEGFASCVWIWIASWALCALMALIPGRFVKGLVQ